MTKLVKLSDVEEMINGRIEQLRNHHFHQKKYDEYFILKLPLPLITPYSGLKKSSLSTLLNGIITDSQMPKKKA